MEEDIQAFCFKIWVFKKVCKKVFKTVNLKYVVMITESAIVRTSNRQPAKNLLEFWTKLKIDEQTGLDQNVPIGI